MLAGGEDGLHLAFVTRVYPKSTTVVPLGPCYLPCPFLDWVCWSRGLVDMMLWP